MEPIAMLQKLYPYELRENLIEARYAVSDVPSKSRIDYHCSFGFKKVFIFIWLELLAVFFWLFVFLTTFAFRDRCTSDVMFRIQRKKQANRNVAS